MFILIALLNPAHADRALQEPSPPLCNGAIVTVMLPAHNSTDLPSVVQPFVAFDQQCPVGARIAVLDADSQTIVDVTNNGVNAYAVELPVLELEPGDYSLRVYGGAGDLLDRAEFHVSGGEAIAPEAPVLHIDASTYGDQWVDLQASVEGAPVPGVVVYSVDGADFDAVATDAWFSTGIETDDAVAELCVSARVRGVSDVWSPTTTACVTPTFYEVDEDQVGFCGVGCSSLGKIPAGGGFLLASLVGLFARLRERLG